MYVRTKVGSRLLSIVLILAIVFTLGNMQKVEANTVYKSPTVGIKIDGETINVPDGAPIGATDNLPAEFKNVGFKIGDVAGYFNQKTRGGANFPLVLNLGLDYTPGGQGIATGTYPIEVLNAPAGYTYKVTAGFNVLTDTVVVDSNLGNIFIEFTKKPETIDQTFTAVLIGPKTVTFTEHAVDIVISGNKVGTSIATYNEVERLDSTDPSVTTIIEDAGEYHYALLAKTVTLPKYQDGVEMKYTGQNASDIQVSNGLYYHSYVGGSNLQGYTGQHAVYVERYNPDVTVIFKGGPEKPVTLNLTRTGNYWNPPSTESVTVDVSQSFYADDADGNRFRTANLYDLLTRDAKQAVEHLTVPAVNSMHKYKQLLEYSLDVVTDLAGYERTITGDINSGWVITYTRLHDVTFDPGIGSSSDQLSYKVEHGSKITVTPGVTVPTGYVHKGWAVTGSANIVNPFDMTITEDTSFTAVYEAEATEPSENAAEVQVIYDPNGGIFSDGTTGNKVFAVQEGDSIVIIDKPVREGYTFLHWEGSKYYPGDTYVVPAGGHTFKAVWQPVPIKPSNQTNATTPKAAKPTTAPIARTGESTGMYLSAAALLLIAALAIAAIKRRRKEQE